MIVPWESLSVFYAELFKPIMPRSQVKQKVEKLTAELQELLALPLENTITYSGGIYQVNIGQLVPLNAEPPYGRVFCLRFNIQRYYIRLQILTIPYCLRHKGYGLSAWKIFHEIWSDSFQHYEIEYKTEASRKFWEQVGFSVDPGSYTNMDYGKNYSAKKMKFTGTSVYH